MKAELPISVRLSEAAKANLRQEAAREDRSMNYIIRRIVDQYFDQKRRKKDAS